MSPESDTETETDAEVIAPPLNRAERRARGKGAPQVTRTGRILDNRPRDPMHQQRNWARRRSG